MEFQRIDFSRKFNCINQLKNLVSELEYLQYQNNGIFKESSIQIIENKKNVIGESGKVNQRNDKSHSSKSFQSKKKENYYFNLCLPNNSSNILQEKIFSSNFMINKYFLELKQEREHRLHLKFGNTLTTFNQKFDCIRYMSRLLDNTWAIITSNNILNISLTSDMEFPQILFDIPYKSLEKILTEPHLTMVHLVTHSDSDLEELQSKPADIIFGNNDRSDNEHFISCLVVAILSWKRSQSKCSDVFLDVIQLSSVLEIPTCQQMRKYFVGETIQLVGLCVTYRTEAWPVFMMKRGNENYKAVLIKLKANFLSIFSKERNGEETPQDILLVLNIFEISSIRRIETPRPHSLVLISKSITLTLAGSNNYLTGLLFDAINLVKRKPVVHEKPESAHIVITDTSLLLFSTEPKKSVRIRIPLLNILKIKAAKSRNLEFEAETNHSKSIIIETESLEAEEGLLPFQILDFQWCLCFNDEIEMQNYLEVLSLLCYHLQP